MKRAFSFWLVSFLILGGLSGCALLGGGTHTPSTPTPMGRATANPTTIPTLTSTPIASSTSSPALVSQVITQYYDAIKAQNYPQAYPFLDANATDANGQKITLSRFEQLAHTMESAGGQVVSFLVAVYPSLVVMSVTRTFLIYHAHLQVKQEGQTWKITSLDRI